MTDQFCVRVQELAISLVGAAADACKGAIVRYLDVVYPRLEQYLTMTHNNETQVIHVTLKQLLHLQIIE